MFVTNAPCPSNWVLGSLGYMCVLVCMCVCVCVIACRVGADITLLREREVDYESDKPRKIAEVLVRKVPDNQQVSARMS